jgi:hypothetical protein
MLLKFGYAITALLAGIVCYFVAKKRGFSNPIIWLAAGTIFHLVAVVVVICIAKFIDERKKGASHGRTY